MSDYKSQDAFCIFVNGEILQMHTIHESNYTVIKLPRNGNSKAKNN